MPLVPLPLSHVVFEEGDRLGYFLAIVSLGHLYVAVSTLTLGFALRDVRVPLVAAGQVGRRLCTPSHVSHQLVLLAQVLNIVVSYVLKKIIKDPRPNGVTTLMRYLISFTNCRVLTAVRFFLDRPE